VNQTEDQAGLTELVRRVLEAAIKRGATAAEAGIGTGSGLSITVRMGEVETIEHQRDKGLSITVFKDKQKGNASTTDFSDKAIQDSIEAAVTFASSASPDTCSGLLEPEYLATDIPQLDLCHPWEIAPEDAVALARECESEAIQQDKRINNSDGATLNTYSGTHVYGNTNSFINGWDWSTHSIDCAVIAEQDGNMQRDGWYSKNRNYRNLQSTKEIGRQAGIRTLEKLGARKLETRNVPVIFEAPVATGLFSSFLSAIAGGALYRKASFLLDKLDQQVFAGHINIQEQPHILQGIGSKPFDSEGMATRNKDLIRDGILQSYILSAYSARKLGMKPTGNAGGVNNVIIQPGDLDLEGMLKKMDTGLLITDMIGFGINQVTGDYSRGASGMWVENGEIQYPVEEITVAGNLAEMYRQIIDIGNDVDHRGNIQTGSVLIEEMMVAGK